MSLPPRVSLDVLDHPKSATAEAFRSLRTSIMLSRVGGGPRYPANQLHSRGRQNHRYAQSRRCFCTPK